MDSANALTVETKVKTSEPAKKKRKVIEDSDDDVPSTTIPSPPRPKKSPRKSTSPTAVKTSKPAKASTPPTKRVEEPASENESDTASVEDEPDLDPKTKKKSAETMYLPLSNSRQCKLDPIENILGSRYSRPILCSLRNL
jgi:hypothetical protein